MNVATLLRRGGVAPAFTPAALAGLKGWYKADGTKWQDSARTTPATADTDPVGAWDDASGLGNHLIQATAGKRPTLKTGIVGALPVLRFDGGDGLRLNSLTLTSFSIFLVYKASGTAGILVEHNDTGGGANGGFLYGTTTSTVFVRRSNVNSDKNLSTDWGINANYRMVTHTMDGTHAGHTLRIDRTGQTLATGLYSNDVGAASTAAPFNLFARNNAASLFTTGDAAELVVVSPSLSDADRDLVEAYLRTKWGTA